MMQQDLSEPNPLAESYDPISNGMPIVIRTSMGCDILCVAWVPRGSGTTGPMIIERPVEVFFETTFPDPDTNEVKSQIRFARWMPLSDATTFPLFAAHVLSMAPLTELVVNAYAKWSESLYQSGVQLKDRPVSPATDRILRDFDPSGKKVC